MDYIYIGDVVNTHGLKGEVRIKSNFKYKDLVFIPNNNIYIGRFYDLKKIKTHRTHKDYDMLTLEGINSIEDAIIYKGDKVYINRFDIKIDGYFNEDLIGLDAYINNKKIGSIKDISSNGAQELLVINGIDKHYLVPNLPNFIEKIDIPNNRIDIIEMEGLIDEN